MKFSRQDYLDKKCSHSEYYSQWVTDATRATVTRNFGQKINQSADSFFNDIPLIEWDRLAFGLSRSPDNSLASRVCVLKEAARQIRGH